MAGAGTHSALGSVADTEIPSDTLAKALAQHGGLSHFSSCMVAHYLRIQSPGVVSRVLAWVEELVAGGESGRPRSVLSPPNAWQRGCPEIIPGLCTRSVWFPLLVSPPDALCSAVHAVVASLEPHASAIREELLSLQGKHVFQPYRAPVWSHGVSQSPAGMDDGTAKAGVPPAPVGYKVGVTSGVWSVCYLDLHNVDCTANRALCPRTCAVIDGIPRRYGHAVFSSLAPGTRVAVHTGPTNRKLRIQLPLVVPSLRKGDSGSLSAHTTAASTAYCALRVGGETCHLAEGRCVVFDDSFQHEAWNAHPHLPRLVLIVDIWHPELSDQEVRALELIRAKQLRAAKAASAAGLVPAKDDWYSIIREAKCSSGSDLDDSEAAVFGVGLPAGSAPLLDAPFRDD